LLTWRSPSGEKYRTLDIDAAQATFELENIGGSPVRIVEAQSSCGCAIPEIPATPIGPGEVLPFKVKAVPLQIGERDASIILRMDSPASPEIVLRLHVVGSRRPPYMTQAKAELAFTGGSSGETQEIIAYQVELAGSKPLPPSAKTDLSFLRIAPPVLIEERPYRIQEAVLRKYRFGVSLDPQLSSGMLSGDVSIIDPWDSDHVQSIRVHYEPLPPIRVAPSRILVHADRLHGDKPVANLLVLSTIPVSDLVAELVPNEKSPLVLGELKLNDDRRRASLSISLKQGVSHGGIYHIRIGRSSSPERITVPVAVRAEEAS
jgi:hypothetical protein